MYFTTKKMIYNMKVANPKEQYVLVVANIEFDSSPCDESAMKNTRKDRIVPRMYHNKNEQLR